MNPIRIATVLAAVAITLLGLAQPAGADHNVPEVVADGPGACGTTSFTIHWPEGEAHRGQAILDTTVLVVSVVGVEHTASTGETVTVGPFDSAPVAIDYRVDSLPAEGEDTPTETNYVVPTETIEVEGCVPGPAGEPGADGPAGAEGPRGPRGSDGATRTAPAATPVAGQPDFTG